MWRVTKRLLVDCIQYGIRCIRTNQNANEVDEDISDFDIDDVSVQFQPRTISLPSAQPLQHRPDAPGTRRRSAPEVVMKVRQAIEEMTIMGLNRAQGDHASAPFSLINDTYVISKI